MAKLVVICLTAVAITFIVFVTGPVMVKETELEFIQAIAGAHVIKPVLPNPDKIVFHSPVTVSPLPTPDLPQEPADEPREP